jgi:hypothetical protein
MSQISKVTQSSESDNDIIHEITILNFFFIASICNRSR